MDSGETIPDPIAYFPDFWDWRYWLPTMDVLLRAGTGTRFLKKTWSSEVDPGGEGEGEEMRVWSSYRIRRRRVRRREAPDGEGGGKVRKVLYYLI